MGVIEIEGLKFYAYHGHFEMERVVGNQFEVNIRIITDCSKAAETDKLMDALNYQEVYETIKKVMVKNSYLLENVAKRILDSLFEEFPTIETARVKVSKMNPPMGGDIEKVSVTLER
jgi:dihydroneopterin aldolase